MSEKYEHERMPSTKEVAMELIFKTYVGKPPINEDTIIEEVYQIHESCGGLPPDVREPELNLGYNISDVISARVRSMIKSALPSLHSNGGATSEKQLWRIHKVDIHSDEKTYPKNLGTGSQEVYLYYYPAYRDLSELKRPPVWKQYRKDALWRCKIGETHDQDTETRNRTTGTCVSRKKVIALIMKTDDSKQLETMIHDILKMWDRWVENAEGEEWFLTSLYYTHVIFSIISISHKAKKYISAQKQTFFS